MKNLNFFTAGFCAAGALAVGVIGDFGPAAMLVLFAIVNLIFALDKEPA